ncbi:hypothetical protein O0L34_g7541 [Tuta absoluta]|nr:hypothetical protein O0L34_g7541 [Tuta absoluta]
MDVKMSKDSEISPENEHIQMAVLPENYNFDDVKVDMTMDVIILKTYDSLTPFEKMLLKCGSVLGDIFSRRMLLHLLQSDSERKIAKAVAKLFEIRVLECEGGDFSRDTSMVLIHSAPVPDAAVKPPNCACLGTRVPPNCHDLPMYSFCGYMKFRHTFFRTTTYGLLTENQKLEMHSRSLMYLERYTRRCTSCGAGCFINLFGVRSDDGLKHESRKLHRMRQQIAALSAETRVSESVSGAGITSISNRKPHMNIRRKDSEQNHSAESLWSVSSKKLVEIRSFSSLDVENCECLPILLSVYNQAIDHCRVYGNCNKLFETYMEFVDLSLLTLNIPQAIRLLMDAENDIQNKKCCNSDYCKISWIKDYQLARIYTWRGCCMLESGDHSEAKKHLLRALELFGCKFPTTNVGVKFYDMQASLQQFLCLNKRNGNRAPGWKGKFYDHVSMTLNQLFRLFMECRDLNKATLAAKWSLKFARKSNSTFRTLCLSYGNMIAIYRLLKSNFSKCVKLEKLAKETCHRKRGHLDITEVYSVCVLYTNLFYFYVSHGSRSSCLDFGLSIMPMLSSQPDPTIGQMMVQWMLRLLLVDLRIHEMVMIMKEFYFMTDFYDLSSETWYHFYAVTILLDTGYCVESYSTCEKFYIKQGDAILRAKTPEAAWNFFVVMWLVTLRVGAWERAILWEDKIKEILPSEYLNTELNLMLLSRLVEAVIIQLVSELDNRNFKKTVMLEKAVKFIFKKVNPLLKNKPMYKPRFMMKLAYFHRVMNKEASAFRYLNKANELSKEYGNTFLMIWIEHTKQHWKGRLSVKLKDYWTEHVEAHCMLDYKNFDPITSQIVPYTLPLPRDFNL